MRLCQLEIDARLQIASLSGAKGDCTTPQRKREGVRVEVGDNGGVDAKNRTSFDLISTAHLKYATALTHTESKYYETREGFLFSAARASTGAFFYFRCYHY